MSLFTGQCIWTEDDAVYIDKERLHQAWKRLFNEKLDLSQSIVAEDNQDHMLHLMPNGYIACVSYPGNSAIYDPAG